jgi:hypothetical protein
VLRFAWLLALAGVVAVSACGGDEASEPPWGLETVRLPDDRAAVTAAFEALPKRLAGGTRSADLGVGCFLSAFYRAPDRMPFGLRAGPVNCPQTRPPLTTLDHLRILARGAEVEDQSLEPSGRLVYIAVKTKVDFRPAWAATWASPRGRWLFSAIADSAETRADLVEAFVEAVQE